MHHMKRDRPALRPPLDPPSDLLFTLGAQSEPGNDLGLMFLLPARQPRRLTAHLSRYYRFKHFEKRRVMRLIDVALVPQT